MSDFYHGADTRKYITPYLGKDIQYKISNARKMGKTVFIKAFPELATASCRNCGDMGYVYVDFCKAGPFPFPPSSGKAIITWFDGNQYTGKGWYIKDDTFPSAAPCPHCKIAEMNNATSS